MLAYEMPDGRLKLIDGHLRRDIDPDMEVDVEVLDVNDEEARTLLLSIDPLAALAETEQALHERLMEITPTSSEELQAAWQATVEADWEKMTRPESPEVEMPPEQFLVLVTCRDEEHQGEVFERLHGEGLQCRVLMG